MCRVGSGGGTGCVSSLWLFQFIKRAKDCLRSLKQTSTLVGSAREFVTGQTTREWSELMHVRLFSATFYESRGGFLAGKVTAEEHDDVIKHACPGPGACGGMFTANTMAR
jgi:hypothetical protein